MGDTWGGSWGSSWGLSWTKSSAPPVVVTPTVTHTGGWKLPLRQWYVEKNGRKEYYDSPEAARNALYEIEEREIASKKRFKVVSLGKAANAEIGFAGQKVADFTIRGKTGLEIIEQGDIRMMRALEAMILRAVFIQEDERDVEILLLTAV